MVLKYVYYYYIILIENMLIVDKTARPRPILFYSCGDALSNLSKSLVKNGNAKCKINIKVMQLLYSKKPHQSIQNQQIVHGI